MTDLFTEYDIPETNWFLLKGVLELFGFTQRTDIADTENLHFTKGDRRVMVPNENTIYGITVKDIIFHAGLNEKEFFIAMRVLKLRLQIDNIAETFKKISDEEHKGDGIDKPDSTNKST